MKLRNWWIPALAAGALVVSGCEERSTRSTGGYGAKDSVTSTQEAQAAQEAAQEQGRTAQQQAEAAQQQALDAQRQQAEQSPAQMEQGAQQDMQQAQQPAPVPVEEGVGGSGARDGATRIDDGYEGVEVEGMTQ